MTQVLYSREDNSVNFVTPCQDGGAFEARFVRRDSGSRYRDDYIICYLSSHSGCNQACRFCHLTQTGQTMMTPATIDDFKAQAIQVLEHYKDVGRETDRVNFNFMARGEPLLNPTIVNDWKTLAAELTALAWSYGLPSKFNISTIYPAECTTWLGEIFKDSEVHIYYSAYTAEHDFRRKWLPKAWSVRYAMEQFKLFFAQNDKSTLTLHGAMIAGENDSQKDLDGLIYNIRWEELEAKFNLVRYNPYSPAQGRESDPTTLQRNFSYMQRALSHPDSRIVPRVGFDVKASCGMFVDMKQVDSEPKPATNTNGK